MSQNGQIYFLKILQYLVQDFHSVPDHFKALCINRLKTDKGYFQHKHMSFDFI